MTDSIPKPRPMPVTDYLRLREQILRDLVNAGESDDPRMDELIQLARYAEQRRPGGI